MNDMIAFCTAMLNAVCDFLIAPPVFYLFSLVCFAAVVGMEKNERQGRNAPAFVAFYGLLNLHFQRRNSHEEIPPFRLE